MGDKIEQIMEIDDEILKLIQKVRHIWPAFNSIGPVDKLVHHLNEAYKASAKVADMVDKGWDY